MNEQHASGQPVGEAVAFRRLADLFLFAAGYFLSGPDERSHALLADPSWRSALADSSLLDCAGESGDPLDFEQHTRQFRELFRVPGPRYVPPMEQAYRGEKATFDASAVGECQTVYEAAGYDPAPFGATQPDHIGHQLRFLHAVAAREADCLERGDPAAAERAASWRRGFLRDHGGWWVEMARQAGDRKPCAEMRLILGLVVGLARHAAAL